MSTLSRQDLKASARTCAVCGKRLSAYNAKDTCFAHTVELPWTGPSSRPR